MFSVSDPRKGKKESRKPGCKRNKVTAFTAAGNEDLIGAHPVRPEHQALMAGIAPATESESDHQERAYWKALEPFSIDGEGMEIATGTKEEEGTREEEDTQGQYGKSLPVPELPSRKEQEEHVVTHWPFRKWGDHSVRVRAQKKEGHAQGSEEGIIGSHH